MHVLAFLQPLTRVFQSASLEQVEADLIDWLVDSLIDSLIRLKPTPNRSHNFFSIPISLTVAR